MAGKEKNIRAGIFLCLLLLWMSVIFSFSAQKAVQSTKVSRGVSYRTVDRIQEILGLDMEEEQIEQTAEKIEFPVRKAAHMTEYAILGCLFLGTFCSFKGAWRGKIVASQIATMLYAATDEFHQTFVTGRDGSVRDVLIDGTGCLIALVIAEMIHRKRGKQEQNQLN